MAYASPALGHLLPISALLSELCRRGHAVHVRTLSTGAEVAQRLGFTADAIDPRIEVARCGTRLPAKKLAPPSLRTKVREAMTMTDGAKRVAEVSQPRVGSPQAPTCSSNALSASTEAEQI